MGIENSVEGYSRVIYLDVIGGIAGDMFIAGVLDCFPELSDVVHTTLRKVLPQSIGELKVWREQRCGISGNRADLVYSASGQREMRVPDSRLKYIVKLIADSDLTEKQKHIAITMFDFIGEAESLVHGVSMDKVHFHELADWDSLMDIVGSAVILDALSDYRWELSSLPMGNGMVKTEHGQMPVPAPATMILLQGFNLRQDAVSGERITPTGAAILKYLHASGLLTQVEHGATGGTLKSVGYGHGTKKIEAIPNSLRLSCFEYKQNAQTIQVGVIEFTVDDMTGEELGLSLDLLRAEKGVIDLYSSSCRGKKNRPVEHITILCEPKCLKSVEESCFKQTSTIGLRHRFEMRECLSRVERIYAGYSVKLSGFDDEVSRSDLGDRQNSVVTSKMESDQLSGMSTLAERRALKYKVELSVNEDRENEDNQ